MEKHQEITAINQNAENLFLASRNGLWTYDDLSRYSKFFLQYLFDFEHDFSRPVGFLSESKDEYFFALSACWLMGIPFACFSINATDHELKRQFELLNPGLILTGEGQLEKVPVDNRVGMKQISIDRALKFSPELSRQAQNFEPKTQPEDVFGYFFTSGTTGVPKIVPLKRRQMYSAAASSAENFKPRFNHFWLHCMPLNHIGGVSIILRSILYGSGIYRMNHFDEHVLSTFLSENNLFQAASLVPTMLKRLLDIPTFHTHKNFKAILLGGGPIDTDLIRESIERGTPLVPSYGMTETCAQISANPILKPSGMYGPLKSVGTVFAPNEIEIRDSQNNKVPYNESGTIWLRGPQVFDGYLNEMDNQQSMDPDGWFNTGDFGHLNANSQLFIESRRNDLIVTGGENVSPFEIESELERIDPISEAAVLGIEDKEWGQRIVAVVVARTEQQIKTEEIREKLKERITSYKVPRQIVQAPTLPRTQSGKIMKHELLKLFK